MRDLSIDRAEFPPRGGDQPGRGFGRALEAPRHLVVVDGRRRSSEEQCRRRSEAEHRERALTVLMRPALPLQPRRGPTRRRGGHPADSLRPWRESLTVPARPRDRPIERRTAVHRSAPVG